MAKSRSKLLIADEAVMSKIYFIRGYKVMLDSDLASLYQVETKALKQAVKRNKDIFPHHFMFELNEKEAESLRSQFVTSNSSRGGSRYLPIVFTEHGVLQVANVLRSLRARQMSIRIIEVFVKIQKMITDNLDVRLAIEKLERKTENNTKNIEVVFSYFEELLEQKSKPRKQLGFKIARKKK